LQIVDAIALVTGGCKGLGLAIASHLNTSGARVIVADIDKDALSKIPDGIDPRMLDVTVPQNALEVVQSIVDQYGQIDILINNAGMIYNEPFVNIMNPQSIMHGYDSFCKTLNINLNSVFIMSSAVIEAMVKRRNKGSIINISSISACGNEGQTAYSAAKAAVNAMTVTWAKELGPHGIRCNAVAPGFIDTVSTGAALDETHLKHIRSCTPLRRLGQAKDVALAVAALIENDFLNGVILRADGGLRI